MAVYHLSAKVFTRKKGHSAVAAASYRSGNKLYDERENRTYDYTRKQEVQHSAIVKPENAPQWASDRQSLWNEVEKAESRKDSQLAREVEVALPRELSLKQNIDLINDYVKHNFTNQGMVADYSIHEHKKENGETNPHTHIMLTTRTIDSDGFGKKNRDWNSTEQLEKWRETWGQTVNKHLANADSYARIDHRSFKARGIEKQPTQHMGKDVTALEKRGIHTEIGNRNRAIAHFNRVKQYARASKDYVKSNIRAMYHRARQKVQQLQDTPTGIISPNRTVLATASIPHQHERKKRR